MTAVIAKQRLQAILPADQAECKAAATVAAKPTQGAHEVTRPTTTRKRARDWGSANNITALDAKSLRDYARHLERDHDISRNALNILTQNIVGSGIDVMPAPRLPGQPIERGLATDLRDLWDIFWDHPEVTGMHDLGKSQDLLARSWMRDGEAMYQELYGPVPGLQYDTPIQYAIELLEADMLPLDLNDQGRRITQGIEKNAWGRPVAYHLYKQHPGDPFAAGWSMETKRVPAAYIRRMVAVDRIHQLRGLSVFASVISRLEDIKDYEESERVASKVAASLSAQIVKGQPEMYTGGDDSVSTAVVPKQDSYRQLTMRPGLIADDLLPGERIEIIDSKRPNPNVASFRGGQLRAAAGGLGVSYSSLSLDYDGTYSAQRQELVERWGAYHKLGEQFIAMAMRPMWKTFVMVCAHQGLIRLPRGWTLQHAAAASYVRPVMPWIDPKKEAEARALQEDRNWVAPQRNVLEIGSDPEAVLQETAEWHARRRELGLPPPGASSSAPAAADTDDTDPPLRDAPGSEESA